MYYTGDIRVINKCINPFHSFHLQSVEIKTKSDLVYPLFYLRKMVDDGPFCLACSYQDTHVIKDNDTNESDTFHFWPRFSRRDWIFPPAKTNVKRARYMKNASQDTGHQTRGSDF